MDFDYFTSVVRDVDELDTNYENTDNKKEILYEPTALMQTNISSCRLPKKWPNPEDFTNEELNTILKSEINQYEFSILLVQVLQSLCLGDIVDRGLLSDNSKPSISVQSLNFALENICGLQFGSASSIHSFTNVQIYELKSAMTQLMLLALEKCVKQPDNAMTIIHNGILPIMLRLLDDVTNKYINNKSEEKTQEFIFGIMYGITQFLYQQLLQKSSLDNFTDFLELFHLFTDCQNGKLIENTITLMLAVDSQEYVTLTYNRVKKVIDCLGQLIVLLKKVRSELVHAQECQKTRHKKCRKTFQSLEKHHHQDQFGSCYGKSQQNASLDCCISTLFMDLVKLLDNDELQKNVDLQIRLLKIMILSGTCCCFPTTILMSKITKMLEKNSSRKIRPLVFTLLERTLYSELGAFIKPTNKITECDICNKQTNLDNQSFKYYTSGEYLASESFERVTLQTRPTYASYYSTDQTINNWDFLQQYYSLINSQDIKLSYATTSHLLRCAPKCTPRVRYELLFSVFYPTFLDSQTEYSTNPNEHSKFKTLTCLSVFASLLSSVPFAEQFMRLDGLNQIKYLINNPEFSKASCAVLENTVIIEIWKLECDLNCVNINKQEQPKPILENVEMDKLPSLQMLLFSLEASTKELLYIFENEGCFYSASDDGELKSPDESVDSFVQSEAYYVHVLPNCSVFWRTMASLCLYSPHIRQFVGKHSINQMGGELLWVILKRLVKSEYVTELDRNSRERRLLMKLLGAILTVKLTALEQVTELGNYLG